MYKIYFKSRILKILSLCCVIFCCGRAEAAKLPTVQLKYANLFDPICSKKAAYPISPNWIEELNKKLPEWQKVWDEEGELLLNSAIKIVGQPFPQNYYTVPLSICNFPSMSEPLMVNVRYSLSSFAKNPITTEVTISTIEHEIFHTYIDSFLQKNTPLLKTYQHESPTVLNHLHLFALQKAIYLSLNQKNILKAVISKDSSLPNGEYKRAWEIVNKEGYLPFINELKTFRNRK